MTAAIQICQVRRRQDLQRPRERVVGQLLGHLHGRWPRRVFAVLEEWRRRSRGRRELAAMSDRSLRDIGVTRGDAYREAQKPFWRA